MVKNSTAKSLRARHLHDRGRLQAVEGDVGVREVVHDVDAVAARERDHALEELEVDALRGRIAGEAEDHHLRLRERLADRALELGEEVHARRHAHRADVGAGDDRAVDVDRIARVGHQHRVAALERGEHQVREAFLRADRDDRLAVGVDLDLVAALVPVGDRATQTRDALGHRVAVGVGPLRGFDELVDDVRAAWARPGLPMHMSMMSSPRRRAAILSSPVMLKT